MAESDKSDRSVYRPPLVVTAVGAVVGLSTVFAIIGVMVWVGQPAVPPPAEDAVQPRTLGEVRAADEEALTTYAWIDREQGIVRIPVERAMELLVEETRGQGDRETGGRETGGQGDKETRRQGDKETGGQGGGRQGDRRETGGQEIRRSEHEQAEEPGEIR